jgi:hypothetical protein
LLSPVVFLSKITFTKFHYKNLSIRQLNFSLFFCYGLALDNFIEAHFLAANGSVKDLNYFSGTGPMKSALTFKNFLELSKRRRSQLFTTYSQTQRGFSSKENLLMKAQASCIGVNF